MSEWELRLDEGALRSPSDAVLADMVDEVGGVGPALALLFGEIGEVLDQPSSMDDRELLEAIVEQERLSRVHAARRTRLIAELRRRRPGDEPGVTSRDDQPMSFPTSRWAPDELGLALSMSRLTAKSVLAQAARLEAVLPEVMTAFDEGAIDSYRAQLIHDLTLNLPDGQARAVAAVVLPAAGGQTYSMLRADIRAAIMRVDPEGANDRHRQARSGRRVDVYAEEEGMAALRAVVPATEADAIWHLLTRVARSMESDERSLDQRRADLVVDLLRGRLSLTDLEQREPGTSAATGAGAALVQVVVGLDTLTGASEQPGHLIGYGPIPADLAREAAADGVWRRLVTDPLSGSLLDHGRETYRAPKALADFVRARDQVCRHPICRRRAIDSELDHRVRWADGGETSAANLVGHCKHHNLLKEQGGWEVLAHPDGTITWVTPAGHRYSSRPHDYRPYSAGPEPPAPGASPDTEPDPPVDDDPPF
jgi:hypothetical protein